jgi:hypothetical protein
VEICPFLKLLPFENLVGNALAYNREDTTDMGSIGFQPIGGLVPESTGSFNQFTASLYEMIEDCDVPLYIQKTRSNINDQMAEQVKLKTKKLAWAFEDQVLYGVAATSNGFDGLHTIIASSGADQKLTMAANAVGAALSCYTLDMAIDHVESGKPDFIMMSRRTRRRFTQYLRTVGSYRTTRDQYGHEWEVWGDGIPIVVSSRMTDTELCDATGQFSASTGGATSSIFVGRFGAADGLIGLQNGGITTKVFPELEAKDATRTRIKWYVGMALMSTLSLVRICNITDAVAVA